MNVGIERLKKTRAFFLKLIESLTAEQLNEIPSGFNNNVVWHLGHLLTTQQSICYLRGGLKTFTDEKYQFLYKPGTKPNEWVENTEIESMKVLFLTAINQFEKDYEDGLFANYPAWTTGYGIEVNNIDDAISFVLFHEGLHTGYTMSMKHLLSVG